MAESAVMAEKRAKRRQKTLLHGFVYYDDSPCAVECVVREISETGARLKFEAPQLPVTAFELDLPLRGQKFRAEVKWQRDNEIGVVFADISDILAPPISPAPGAPVSYDDLAMRVRRLETEFAALRLMLKRLQQKIANNVEAA